MNETILTKPKSLFVPLSVFDKFLVEVEPFIRILHENLKFACFLLSYVIVQLELIRPLVAFKSRRKKCPVGNSET